MQSATIAFGPSSTARPPIVRSTSSISLASRVRPKNRAATPFPRFPGAPRRHPGGAVGQETYSAWRGGGARSAGRQEFRALLAAQSNLIRGVRCALGRRGFRVAPLSGSYQDSLIQREAL